MTCIDEQPAPVLIISGTRPEIIKLAPVYHALRGAQSVRPVWLHTGQHSDMAVQMLRFTFPYLLFISLTALGSGVLP